MARESALTVYCVASIWDQFVNRSLLPKQVFTMRAGAPACLAAGLAAAHG